jgi:hypothetical protein
MPVPTSFRVDHFVDFLVGQLNAKPIAILIFSIFLPSTEDDDGDCFTKEKNLIFFQQIPESYTIFFCIHWIDFARDREYREERSENK